jgi:hypothetical protein
MLLNNLHHKVSVSIRKLLMHCTQHVSYDAINVQVQKPLSVLHHHLLLLLLLLGGLLLLLLLGGLLLLLLLGRLLLLLGGLLLKCTNCCLHFYARACVVIESAVALQLFISGHGVSICHARCVTVHLTHYKQYISQYDPLLRQ